MIALKNTTNNQIFYIIHKKMYGKSDGYGLTTLDVEYTENGQYSINPPSGYDGLSSVNVTVDVENGDCNLTTSTVTITGDGEHTITPPEGYDGFSEVVVKVDSDCDDAYNDGVADQKAKLASATFTENGSYNREDGWNTVQVNVDTVTPYNEGVEDGKDAQKALMTSLTAVSNGTYTREDGYNEVVVNVPSAVNNQNKQVTYTQNGTQTVLADSGYSGLGQVQVSVNVDTVTPYNNGKQDGIDEQKSKMISGTFTQNGTFNREDGYNQVVVDVDTVTPYNNGKQDGINEQKAKLTDITIVSNGHYSREDGYNDITVNVPSDINNQNKQITYTQNGTQTIVADNGYSGLGQVAVTVNVDTVTPYNDGFEDGVADQKSKLTTGTFTSNGTYVRPDGYNQVVINVPSDIHNQNKTVNPSTSQQVITANQGYSGLGQVTVNAVTASIDPDIRPENIKKDVEILGVVGTYEVDCQPSYDEGYEDGEADQKAKLTTLTVTQNGTYTRADGYDEVIVNVQCGQSTLYVDPMSITTDENGGTYTVNLYSSTSWQFDTLPSWITLSQNSGNAGITSITVTIDPSTDGARNAGLTISNSDSSAVISITQTFDYSTLPLTLEVIRGGTLYWKQYGIAYSRTIQVNGGDITSLTTNDGCRIGYFPAGSKISIRANAPSHPVSSENYYYFVFKDGLTCNVSGNLGSFDTPYRIFSGCTGIISAENLIVPEGVGCASMFSGCTGLTTAPKVLPGGYYMSMFYNCTNLVNAPELPSTTLTRNCYNGMFYGCNSLVDAPELPATTLAEGCYGSMFRNCAALTTAPELPAETLVTNCYQYMFMNSSNVNYIKAMFTTTPGNGYTGSWVYDVAPNGTFVKNSAATWDVAGNNGIPSGWTVQTASA